MNPPKTSTTLLQCLATEAQSARWAEFVAKYEPMMRAYLTTHFPYCEADDILQETFVALVRILPEYHYDSGSNGYFHNYLTGILRRKALKGLEKSGRQNRIKERFVEELKTPPPEPEPDDERAWRESVFSIVLGQFMSDESVASRTKQIFKRTAIQGEKPEEVAAAFGVSRQVVDQIKFRTLEKLRKLASELIALENGEKHV